MKPNRIKTFCKHCNKELNVIPARIKDGRGKFCSRQCYAKWKSKNSTGEKNNNWKNGIRYCMGYIYLYKPEHPKADRKGYIKKANVVYENNTGIYPGRGYVLHHKNKNKLDDGIENLELMTISEHHKYHHLNDKFLQPYYNRKKEEGHGFNRYNKRSL